MLEALLDGDVRLQLGLQLLQVPLGHECLAFMQRFGVSGGLFLPVGECMLLLS